MNDNTTTPISNMDKYYNYRRLFAQLKKAIANECYYEAIFIEYAIFEDRTEAMLLTVGIGIYEKNSDKKLKMDRKLNLLKSREEFVQNKFIRERLTDALIEQVRDWKNERNTLVHELPNVEYNPDSIRGVALNGYDLVKTFRNRVTSITRHMELLQSKTTDV